MTPPRPIAPVEPSAAATAAADAALADVRAALPFVPAGYMPLRDVVLDLGRLFQLPRPTVAAGMRQALWDGKLSADTTRSRKLAPVSREWWASADAMSWLLRDIMPAQLDERGFVAWGIVLEIAAVNDWLRQLRPQAPGAGETAEASTGIAQQTGPGAAKGARGGYSGEGTGAPGRPSSIHFIEQEYYRRLEAGQDLSTKTAEAGALLAWFKTTHPDRQPAGEKTITNNLHRWKAELESRRRGQ